MFMSLSKSCFRSPINATVVSEVDHKSSISNALREAEGGGEAQDNVMEVKLLSVTEFSKLDFKHCTSLLLLWSRYSVQSGE